ncbi:unnamed protein product [Rhizoctonia solani]|uniref:Uncharacterized protein n=1 Tax=Rhizoctonia solani TaxID=456999 RepID=A0A8H3E7F8_9AGAM|nr:unnamed protein product [Rhizoctonia solani]
MVACIQPTDSSPALRVFGIYEIATFICELLSRHDNARLLCVCHRLSQDIRPFVWNHVAAVEPLIQMIPETRVDVYMEEPFPPFTAIYLPDSISLSRISFYSPYIKHLDIPLTTVANAYENWDGFLASTQSIDLLPNLECLSLAIPLLTRGETITIQSLNWITAFLSSSLLCIQIYPDLAWDTSTEKFMHAWITLDYATKLLRSISEKCHRLNCLMIMPGDVETQTTLVDTGTFNERITKTAPTEAVFLKPDLGLELVIPCFNSLRKLSITPFILERAAFVALGKLPYLESLSIRELHIADEWPKIYCHTLNADLETQAFPALRYLDLFDLTYDTVINICGQRQLARAMHGLKPIVTWLSFRKNQLARLLRMLAHDNSPLRQLYLHIPGHWDIPPDFMGHFSHLKLTHLSLPQPNPFGLDYELNELLQSVPALESLEFNEWEIEHLLYIDQLRLIATSLPKLTHLSAPIDFSSTAHFEERDFIPCTPQFPGLFYLETSFGSNNWVYAMNKLARYLHALWPNILCKSRSPLNPEDDMNLTQLSDLLSKLRF